MSRVLHLLAASISLLAPLALGQLRSRGGIGPHAGCEPDFETWLEAAGSGVPAAERRSAARRKTFETNLATIVEHNNRWRDDKETFWQCANAFTHLTSAEMRKYRMKPQGREDLPPGHVNVGRPASPAGDAARAAAKALKATGASSAELLELEAQDPSTELVADINDGDVIAKSLPAGAAASVDWTALGVVTSVKNQGPCNDCWAYGSAAALESAKAIAGGALHSLSAAQLADCARSEFETGDCTDNMAGSGYQAYLYVAANHGLCSWADYPMSPKTYGLGELQTCRVPPYPAHSFCAPAASVNESSPFDFIYESAHVSGEPTLSGLAVTPDKNMTPSLPLFLDYLSVQPVAIAIYAGCDAFQHYGGGYITLNSSSACVPTSFQSDHVVLATGFFTDEYGEQFIQVKNSWGTSWGGTPYPGYFTIPSSTAINYGFGQLLYLFNPTVPNYTPPARSRRQSRRLRKALSSRATVIAAEVGSSAGAV